ncbi:MAG: enoyl-CoA hydratase-related protein, partial [Alphaproteobacteria bacterium]
TPGAGIGLFCSTPSVPLTRAVSQKAAMEMLLTADPVSADQALAIGLINRVVAAEELGAATMALANRISEHPPEVLALGKRTVRAHANQSLAEAYEIAGQAMVENLTFDAAKEGIAAFIEKRPPDWKPT